MRRQMNLKLLVLLLLEIIELNQSVSEADSLISSLFEPEWKLLSLTDSD